MKWLVGCTEVLLRKSSEVPSAVWPIDSSQLLLVLLQGGVGCLIGMYGRWRW